jgi:5-methyltetrahydrofolate--homocysteine methyltransferase
MIYFKENKDLVLRFMPLDEIVPFIDWTPFFHFWNFKGIYPAILVNDEARKVYEAALKVLHTVDDIEVSCILRFFDAHATQDDTIVVKAPSACTCGCVQVPREVRLPMLRQQEEGSQYECLTDFLPLRGNARMGLFCVKVQDHIRGHIVTDSAADNDEYTRLLRDAICGRLADACATWLEKQAAKGVPDNVKIIRPAFGYPASPDHSLKKEVFDILHVEKTIGATLTESYSVIPSTSIVGLMIAHPQAHYFGVGKIGKDQWNDYRIRRGFSEGKMRKLLP